MCIAQYYYQLQNDLTLETQILINQIVLLLLNIFYFEINIITITFESHYTIGLRLVLSFLVVFPTEFVVVDPGTLVKPLFSCLCLTAVWCWGPITGF